MSSDTSSSALAWEVAKRCQYEMTSHGVKATVTVSRAVSVYGVGRTHDAAMQDLAVNLDKWAKQAD